MKNNIALSLTGLALVGLLSACSGQASADLQPAPSVTNTPTQVIEVDPAAAEEAVVAPVEDSILSFGETKSWKYDTDGDGSTVDSDPELLSISVAAPEDYKPSESAMSVSGQPAVKFDVTVTNTGTQLFDPASISATLQSGGSEAEQLFDSANEINGAPMTSILPGDSVTFPVAFNVADPSQLVLEVSVAYDLSVIFTNRV